eukprot:7383398-Prymnesium_polylepis.1
MCMHAQCRALAPRWANQYAWNSHRQRLRLANGLPSPQRMESGVGGYSFPSSSNGHSGASSGRSGNGWVRFR